MESTTAEGDCGGELDSDVGVGAHGIHALELTDVQGDPDWRAYMPAINYIESR
jgi:hypothetical protein